MARSTFKEFITFVKAQGSAIVATGCDYLARIIFDKFFGTGYVAATFLGAVTGGVVNCAVNYRWVFDCGERAKRDVALRYLLVWVGSVALNTGGTALLKEVAGLRAYMAMVVTSVLVAVGWNYTMQRMFVFKRKRTEKDETKIIKQ